MSALFVYTDLNASDNEERAGEEEEVISEQHVMLLKNSTHRSEKIVRFCEVHLQLCTTNVVTKAKNAGCILHMNVELRRRSVFAPNRSVALG